MPTLTEIMPKLRELYEAKRRPEFVQAAQQVLAQVPTLPELTLLTLKTLAELGLGGPALELLEQRRDLAVAGDEVDRLRSSLRKMPDRVVPWDELRGNFERNCAALQRTRSAWRPRIAALREALAGVELHQTLQGQYVVSRRDAPAGRTWLGLLGPADYGVREHMLPAGKLGAVAVVGVRLGPLLRLVFERSQNVLLWHSSPLYLFEASPLLFAAWMHCEDHTWLLDDERVQVFVGPAAAVECEQLWLERPNLASPVSIIHVGGDRTLDSALDAAITRKSVRGGLKLEQLKAALAERYAGRDAAYWARRLRAPGTVLGITSRYSTMLQYANRDALAAFEALGHRSVTLREPNDHEFLNPRDICAALLEHDPILVLVIDHLRCEHPYLPLNVPFVTWIQDPMPHLLCPDAGASIGPYDLICGYFKDRCVEHYGYPAERFQWLQVPASSQVFHDGPVAPALVEKLACDICFVSHASTPFDTYYRQQLAEAPRATRPLLASLYDDVCRMLADHAYLELQGGAVELVDQATERFKVRLDPVQREYLISQFVFRLYDYGRRQQALEWVANWARRTGRVFKLYGRGWEQHPTLGEFAAGPLEHGEPLRAAYRCAELSLQLLSGGFMHQRSFEALLSGALPLTRYSPNDFGDLAVREFVLRRESGAALDMPAARMPGFERIVFHTPAEFEALAERYLAEAGLREAVRAEMNEVVLREFTYTTAMRTLLEALQAQFERAAVRNGDREVGHGA